ncbi:hypothetical protein DL768_008060 [Monosporascus sp. mg162]|nr:hypothetical protein DL768_008060 [Monosporascus sp. mg162]
MLFPDHREAIVCVSNTPGANLAVSQDAPLPLPLAPDQVLVRTVAVALNPCDWKMPDRFPSIGAVNGSDFAGIIVAVGSDVHTTHADLVVGTRVCGAVHGANPADHMSGSFASYVAATADILMKLPENVEWKDGAAVGGTGIAVLGLVFYEHLNIGFSPRKPATELEAFPVLVYGGGTATGTMAIQLLKASGLRPLAVCSSKSAELALSYGAEKTFDYDSTACYTEIKEYTKGRLRHIIDIISDAASINLCYHAMGRLGGVYVGLELLPDQRPTRRLIKPAWVMGQTVFGKELQLAGGYERPPMPNHRTLAKRWFAEVQEIWEKGAIRPHPVKIGQKRGLGAVLEGVDLMRRRAVTGEKLVYFL